MEKTQSMKGEMDAKAFISRQSWHFSSVKIMIEVVFPTCTLNWSVNKSVSRQGKSVTRRNEITIMII